MKADANSVRLLFCLVEAVRLRERPSSGEVHEIHFTREIKSVVGSLTRMCKRAMLDTIKSCMLDSGQLT